MEVVESLSHSYLWNKDWFYLIRVDEKSREGIEYSYLKADMDVADSVEDEWVVAYLALEISKRYDNLAIQLKDSDGDYLLIEAAQHLPDWMEPEVMKNRFFLWKGHFHVIPQSSNLIRPTIQESLHLLCSIPTPVSSDIEVAINKRIESQQLLMQSSTHHCSGWLPRSWSNLLETYPWLPSYFCRLVLDASELEVSKATEALAELPVVEASMDMIPIHLPKLLFTEIVSATIGKESGASSLLDTYVKSTRFERAKILGNRIRIGSLLWKCPEAIINNETESLQYCKENPSSLSQTCVTALVNNRTFQQYLDALTTSIPSLLQNSVENQVSEKVEEDLKWLEITEQQLEVALHEEEGNLREEDKNMFLNEDMDGSEIGTQVLDSFKSFLSAVSNVEGIDSVVSPTENEMEPNGSRGMNVNFDNVCDILNGYDFVEEEESTVEGDKNNSDNSSESEQTEVVNNLLTSLSLQEGVDGPVNSILTSLGIHFPPQ
ncbi:hypothetical protein JH06_4792 [Blastocystis sp. subtype 4]|uniref:hypothetical protein n=1 Tax=Blastocystis sp. subtype 4 TaxID=944170 RepID=UPI0007115922|nr:hypothetical protein JH06_4792 [Blastocystis sp. subtype 4]KNB42406.1 hypothetical protein JH06_4792 [Blastocystis sp. subtype 4]|eukprot:XP_014525855.1 hypothetical protein JH06_4792 [Blastocystis sp. subtype 4]